MKLPIIVVESHTCFDFYQSVEAVEDYVEAPEALNGSTVAYDADGNLLILKPVSPIYVDVEEPDPPIDKSDELRRDIRDYLVRYRRGDADYLRSAPLSELVNLLLIADKHRYT